ncbi:MAG: hypothetical protein M0R16_08955 [Bacteroidales bacterium]|jgi:hypothetical protein|nr:hypothetical protein [Bacteroidales bacterium]
MSDERYLQFPLCMLRELFIDKFKIIDEIIRFGIYRFATKINYDLYDVAKQLMYCYYRKQGDLTKDLGRIIEKYINSEKIYFDEDYKGFSYTGTSTEFTAKTEIEQILELFDTDPDFKEKAIEFYQIRQAYEFLGITGDLDYCLKRGKEIEKTIPDGEPYPSINKDLLFEFRDHDKTEHDLMQFAFYVGIRSILGIKSYCPTNKVHILCRAFGYASINHLPETTNPCIKEMFNKYLKRYHADRMLEEMQLSWGVHTYSKHMRGLYIGLSKKITLENMILQAERKKQKNQIEQLKQQKHDARQKALQQLNKGQQLK